MDENINKIVIIGDSSVIKNQKSNLKHLNDINIDILETMDRLTQLLSENILLIIHLSDHDEKVLEKLVDIQHKNASVIIVGDKYNASLLSLAISAEISAFLDTNHEQSELEKTIDNVLFKRSSAKIKPTFNALINAKGGGGASFISSNMAYVLSQIKHSKVALLDMDLQFGSIGLNFNINQPDYTMIDALHDVDGLDRVSLSGFMQKYNDNLSLLLPPTEDIIIPGEVSPEALEKLLRLLQDNYKHLIVDLPRLIDPLSMKIMDKAANIVIVLQQNLAQFLDGRRLIQILNKDLEVHLDRIVVIINRFDKSHSLKKSDMVKLVNHDNVFTVANDFDLVASTSDLGIPLCEHSRNSRIAKDLKAIAYALGNIQEAKRKKFMGLF